MDDDDYPEPPETVRFPANTPTVTIQIDETALHRSSSDGWVTVRLTRNSGYVTCDFVSAPAMSEDADLPVVVVEKRPDAAEGRG